MCQRERKYHAASTSSFIYSLLHASEAECMGGDYQLLGFDWSRIKMSRDTVLCFGGR